ncbi:MAG: dTDP-4-dehydrorhamnose 3,5-epimerase [Pseudomonadota bacterium]
MKFTPLDIDGAFLVEIERISDDRGFFARAWCEDEFADAGIDVDFVQANIARTGERGTLRGLHFQVDPAGEAKLIRCTRGRVFDAAVDLRPDSSTRGRSIGIELDSSKQNMVFIPAGCAHGYQVLESDSDVFYLVSHRYAPDAERGLLWNDPALGIDWPIQENVKVSDKDAALPRLAELEL